jgi:hypothetical protein
LNGIITTTKNLGCNTDFDVDLDGNIQTTLFLDCRFKNIETG